MLPSFLDQSYWDMNYTNFIHSLLFDWDSARLSIREKKDEKKNQIRRYLVRLDECDGHTESKQLKT